MDPSSELVGGKRTGEGELLVLDNITRETYSCMKHHMKSPEGRGSLQNLEAEAELTWEGLPVRKRRVYTGAKESKSKSSFGFLWRPSTLSFANLSITSSCAESRGIMPVSCIYFGFRSLARWEGSRALEALHMELRTASSDEQSRPSAQCLLKRGGHV